MTCDTIHHGDCIDVMESFAPDIMDLTVTSPPYDDLRTYNGYSFEFEDIAKQLYRVTKPGGVVVWIVGDATVNGTETCTSFRQALFFRELGFNLHDTMIYRKENPVPVGGSNRYYQAFEYMFVFSKGKPKTFNPIIVPRRNKHGDTRKQRVKGFVRNKDGEFDRKLIIFNDNVKMGNVWSYTVGAGNSTAYKEAFKHPATFPEKLAEDHIRSWSNEGDIVFDPMCGSGTTCRVAKNLGRRYVGIDISEEYCKIARRRLLL